MKLNEIFESQYIGEGPVRSMAMGALATAGLIGAMNSGSVPNKQVVDISPPKTHQAQHHVTPPGECEAPAPGAQQVARNDLAQQIASDYRINPELAYEIVDLAHKYEKESFPKAADILAVIGVESSFNPSAVSRLRKDPARGLMQVRPGKWGLNATDLHNIEDQIRIGAYILHRYHTKLRSKDAAFQAYNIGITNFRRGKSNPRYVAKIKNELAKYIEI